MMKKVKCPNCGKLVNYEGNPYRPFCSRECKLADFYRWLNEEYSLDEEDKEELWKRP
ncbi:MAG: DNA gyrase inhibitor YacG [Nitrospiraceae bacterium]|nr:DNA gyrase inhibitor YacG [Nitrospiraceae bacterium]